jgi:NadR type nicotinamide-nucleotide adenylyltransferase
MKPVQRIAILGAESSGKSTLAGALAARYNTVWVPEYLREFVELHARVPHEVDQADIARIQREREDAAAKNASEFLFCDTTPLMTGVYSRHYWGRVDARTALLERRHDYAFTLVTAPDSPWEADGLQRDSEQVRQAVHERLVGLLREREIAFLLVSGSLQQRVLQADRLINPT